MNGRDAVKVRVRELAARAWDIPTLQARYRRLLQDGIAPRRLDHSVVIAAKPAILDRVQRRAEEYEYLGHN
jgi:hypothetical protein